MRRGSCVAISAAVSFASFASLAGCGARTELLGEPPEDVDSSMARDAALDANGAVDATDTRDSSMTADAPPTFDAARHDDAGEDAAVDAGVDAAPITCPFTTETTLVEDGTNALDQIALDDSYVYFHDGNAIYRVAKSGGTKTALASLKAPAWPELAAFMVDDTYVTWWQVINGATKTDVKHAPKQGGTTTTIATLPSYFYYGSAGPGGTGPNYDELDSIAATGAVTKFGAALPYQTTMVRYDRGDIYTLSPAGLHRFDGAAFTKLADAPPASYPNSMVFDDTTVYVTIGDGVGGFMVASAPKAGGSFTILLTVQSGYLGGIAEDADYIYVADRIAARILRMNKDGSDLTTIVTSTTSQIVDLAVDDQCVYWTETTNSGKPPSRIAAQAL
jgi:hypothetical protein